MAKTGLKPIETLAYGYRFRSRLEARWAVAFTTARIEWQYEPEGFDLGEAGYYLPDFWLPQVKMWAEVKPTMLSDDELQKANALAIQSRFACLLLIGPPAQAAYWAIDPFGWPTEYATGNGLYGSVVRASDFAPFSCEEYHLTESRFYSGTGAWPHEFPMPAEYDDYMHPAIYAARSARFEHGESPS